MNTFQVKSGRHYQDGEVFEKGDFVHSHLELDKIFKNKFVRAVVAPAAPAAPAKEAPKSSKKKTTIKVGKKKTDDNGRGEDVTEQFSENEAVGGENGIQVFKRGTRYHLYESGSETPLNDSGLKKAEVADFLTSYLED